MTTEYSDSKIREILGKVNGQGKLAEQAIRTLITRDQVFLQSLVTPYLNGIIAHGIDRARKQSGLLEPTVTQPRAAAPMPQVKAKPPQRPAAQPVSTSAMDGLMQAWAKKFDDKPATGEVPKSGTVSRSHIDAIVAMASKKKL